MEIKAYAKINWDLRVLGKRADGFHALDSIFVNVSLFDTLNIEPSDTISLTCSDPTLPTDDSNLVVKAAKLLASRSGTKSGAKIHLVKNIPSGGGMGGGSSDAAATLRALNVLWKLNWPVEKLHPLGAELGSDVPFFLHGGWQRCWGRGENVEALDVEKNSTKVKLLLILPRLHVSTPMVYKNLGAPQSDGKTGLRNLTDLRRSLNFTLQQLNENSSPVMLGLRNDLSAAACKVEPGLIPLQKSLQTLFPDRWLMSGSGAVHFVVDCNAEGELQLGRALTTEFGSNIRVLTATTLTP